MTTAARAALGPGGVSALVLAGCMIQHSCSARHGERPDSVPSVLAADSAPHGGADGDGATCRVTRAERTFVGFSDGMSLEDFELAAFEAERILAALQTHLCELDEGLDPDGGLRSGLRARAIEITAVVFTQDDAGAADVQARWVVDADAAGATEPGSWLLRVMRTADVWRVVRVTPARDEVGLTDFSHMSSYRVTNALRRSVAASPASLE